MDWCNYWFWLLWLCCIIVISIYWYTTMIYGLICTCIVYIFNNPTISSCNYCFIGYFFTPFICNIVCIWLEWLLFGLGGKLGLTTSFEFRKVSTYLMPKMLLIWVILPLVFEDNMVVLFCFSSTYCELLLFEVKYELLDLLEKNTRFDTSCI